MDALCSIENCVKQAFCREFVNINESCLKVYWCREKNYIDCDLCVNLQSGLFKSNTHLDDELKKQLEMFSKTLVLSSENWQFPLTSCVFMGSLVKIKLRRSPLIKSVITKVDQLKKKYGSIARSETDRQSVVIIADDEEDVDALNSLRCSLIAQFLCRLLDANGYDVSIVNICKCSDLPVCKSACDSHRKRFETIFNENAKSVGKPRKDSKENSVTNKELEGVIWLEHLIRDHVKQSGRFYLWIASHGKQHKWKAAERIRNELTTNGSDLELETSQLEHVYLVYGHTTGEFKTTNELHRCRELEISKAAEHKLKSWLNVKENNRQSEINILADLFIKFDLLSISLFNPVKLSKESLKEGNQGGFVMYNYSRVVSILESFQKAIGQGIYTSLPDVSQTDFSLLNKNEEWNLMLSCAFYPTFIANIISELVIPMERSSSKPPFHQLLRYAVKLSHDLSVYYNRIHILNEGAIHLQATMHARIWLLLSIKQIFENIFNLLSVEPLSRM